jgi:hypothetical protein
MQLKLKATAVEGFKVQLTNTLRGRVRFAEV